MWPIYGIVILIYSSFVLWIINSWKSIKKPTFQDASSYVTPLFISVIIPIRNESQNILATLNSILDNSLPVENYEIIIINDHSTDDLSFLTEIIRANDVVSMIDMPNEQLGKKRAIELGVKRAKGDIILCTDGDCLVPQNWLKYYYDHYCNDPKSNMCFGPVRYVNLNKFWVQLLNIELSLLVMIGAASVKKGIPSMINGANLSFSKSKFEQVGGYTGNKEIPSGDDEFLLRKIHDTSPDFIEFLKTNEAIVGTSAPSSLKTFINQRRRWASKWKHHTDLFSKLMPMLIFFVNAVSIWGLINLFIINIVEIHVIFLVIKALIDFLIIRISTRFLGVKLTLKSFFLLEIIYPFYVVFFGLASNFGKYTWKERVYQN